MTRKTVQIIGVPIDCGQRHAGCVMGPDAYRVAGLPERLVDLGWNLRDLGNLAPNPVHPVKAPNDRIYRMDETVAWTEALIAQGQRAAAEGLPIFLGGDHSMSMGSVAAMAAHARTQNRPLFVLWLDAHTDYHTLQSSASGNLHGTPVAYFTGREKFEGFPALSARVDPANVCMIGLRSVDAEERAALGSSDIRAHDMRDVDETGIARPLRDFLDRVRAGNGLLHVSLDVDFLDPGIAPAVGTTVPGGATFREAHLVMEILCDSGLVSSLDLAELNPFLDERGRTASLMTDLTASLFGQHQLDRPTRPY